MTSTPFSLQAEDFSRLQRVVAKRLRLRIGTFTLPFFMQVLAWMLASLAVFSLLKMWQVDPQSATPFLYITALLLLAFLVAAIALPWASQRLLAQYMLSSHGTFLSEQRIALLNEGLEVSNSTGVSQMQWSGFIDRDEDAWNLYLFIDAVQALVIPKAVAEALGSKFEHRFRGIRGEA